MAVPTITVGTNSYATVSEAETYFDARTGSDAWDGASADDKTVSLVMATKRLDQELYDGSPVLATQALSWPRMGTSDREGKVVPSSSIPQIVKDATFEVALTILQNPKWFSDRGTEGWSQLETDGATGRPNHDFRAQELPVIVKRMLDPVLYHYFEFEVY